MTASVEWLNDWDRIAAAAGDTLDRARQPRLFDRLDWYRLMGEHLYPGDPPSVLHLSDGASASWLFLVDDGSRRGLALSKWYGLSWRPVVDEGYLDILLRFAAKRHDHLVLQPLDARETTRLESALGRSGWQTFCDRVSTNWTIDVAGKSFADYWRERPGQLRSTAARRMRRYPLGIRIHRVFDEAAWLDYEAIYADSWKPDEGSMPFLRALAEQEGAAGTLRLGIASDDQGRAIAAQLWLVENGIATIHKLAHREGAKHISPGTILSHAMFRAAIDEDHVEHIDFGLGNESYKAEWMDTANPIYRIDAYRPDSLRGLAGIGRERAARLVRRLRGR
ncbi:GNAT family N-acetyltransferase [Sphingomonas sp. CGMCC 1.13654]|uniref:GNAT family N-acetyltransferase n=1 Tax=Sphingomonas chungangi TaxID=2683589 RepID=A0A838L9Y9_9SPHN|nr:GNAT family N-acetyltransferase [Sphingomonas chungangi]MBA2935847.1 GNAT family N-acetyltransferase [Sphingomonas chungangi]MVW54538.1 GNAT family N-acetyltransferase [Sphingomonas chungangi]